MYIAVISTVYTCTGSEIPVFCISKRPQNAGL